MRFLQVKGNLRKILREVLANRPDVSMWHALKKQSSRGVFWPVACGTKHQVGDHVYNQVYRELDTR